jgi:hypothetical protein
MNSIKLAKAFGYIAIKKLINWTTKIFRNAINMFKNEDFAFTREQETIPQKYLKRRPNLIVSL